MFADDITRALPELRTHAESLMLDAGKALRPTGRAYDPEQQAEVDTFDPIFGSDTEPVPCKIKDREAVPRQSEVGGRTAVEVVTELHLPAFAEHAVLAVGDLWEMVDAHPDSLSRVGRRYRITGEADGTLKTACRYPVERVVA